MGFGDFPSIHSKGTGFPGPGRYDIPDGFGPKAKTRTTTIKGPRPGRTGGYDYLGPGRYDIQGFIGEGPKYTFGGGRIGALGGAASTPSGSTRGSESLGPKYEIKCYDMAVNPTSPRYSIGQRRIAGGAEARDAPRLPGPGNYNTEYYDTIKFAHHGGLSFGSPSSGDRVIEGANEAKYNPGPGTYDMKRFGDDMPTPRKPFYEKPKRPPSPGPGPGEYVVDQHSIAKRFGVKPNAVTNPTFGGRSTVGEIKLGQFSPGPGAYTPREPQPHKGISISNRPISFGDLESVYPRPGPGEYNLPSPAGRSISISPRIEPPPTFAAKVPGPGEYTPRFGDLSEKAASLLKGSASKKPFMPHAPRQPPVSAIPTPGPATYSIKPTIGDARAHTMGSRPEKSQLFDNINNTPGPGTYNVKYPEDNKGLIFYKGDFSIERPNENVGPGTYEEREAFRKTQEAVRAVTFTATTH